MSENLDHDKFQRLLDRATEQLPEMIEILGCIQNDLGEQDLDSARQNLSEMSRMIFLMEGCLALAGKLSYKAECDE